MKTRLKAAQKGHSLLKKKADALNMRFRSILGKIVEVEFFFFVFCLFIFHSLQVFRDDKQYAF